MVQYLFNLWNLKLILTKTLISSLVQPKATTPGPGPSTRPLVPE